MRSAGQNKMPGGSPASVLSRTDAFGATDDDRAGAPKSLADARKLLPNGTAGASVDGVPAGNHRAGFPQHAALGFLPESSPAQWPTSTTPEYAIDDFGIAQLAARLGGTAGEKALMPRAQNRQKVRDPVSGTVVPRSRTGFDRAVDLSKAGSQFCEASGDRFPRAAGPGSAARQGRQKPSTQVGLLLGVAVGAEGVPPVGEALRGPDGPELGVVTLPDAVVPGVLGVAGAPEAEAPGPVAGGTAAEVRGLAAVGASAGGLEAGVVAPGAGPPWDEGLSGTEVAGGAEEEPADITAATVPPPTTASAATTAATVRRVLRRGSSAGSCPAAVRGPPAGAATAARSGGSSAFATYGPARGCAAADPSAGGGSGTAAGRRRVSSSSGPPTPGPSASGPPTPGPSRGGRSTGDRPAGPRGSMSGA
ncbi:hypothetical protein RVR_9001 [Actinacidiphila reveromycinica]|uniref:Glycosyl hydrolase family 92 domain-containing protein n=1 Tax=Actinacidiphila reveromycinica TaxID=659352 RepID=A0A7U3VS92_9ACTN|nr:glycoside hydrolase domain-containing protein [Streptomyces sp. SN-593]BBB01534.1 hypothetical protein RVR_9001 [Streptomyces sp. SN-593]